MDKYIYLQKPFQNLISPFGEHRRPEQMFTGLKIECEQDRRIDEERVLWIKDAGDVDHRLGIVVKYVLQCKNRMDTGCI